MKITNLDPKKYKRFFAFGCSVTNYKWLTWADIIGKDIDFYENWAEPGGGNLFIFNSIIEADTRHKFSKDDLIIVFWTNKEREDRYLENKWSHATAGNIEHKYGKEWVEKFYFDSRSFLIRDIPLIKAVSDLLSSKQCDWAMLSWYEFFNSSLLREELKKSNDKEKMLSLWRKKCKEVYEGKSVYELFDDADVIKLYQKVFTDISGIYRHFEESCIKENKSTSRQDDHPLPHEALQFLDWVWPNNTLSSNARNYAINYDFDNNIERPKIIRL